MPSDVCMTGVSTEEKCPEFRQTIDLSIQELEGKRFIVFRDVIGLSPQQAVVSGLMAPVIMCIDGTHTLQQIISQGGQFGIPEIAIRKLLTDLSDQFFLNSPEAESAWKKFTGDYQSLGSRKAYLAGTCYSAQPETLRQELRDYIQSAETGVAFRSHGGAGEFAPGKVVAVMCPHIDYYRGGKCYGATFKFMADVPRPDVIYLIGTSHQPPVVKDASRFILTKKSFETPLGEFKTHQGTVDHIARSFGEERSFNQEILHRTEHSLELQLPFLAERYEENLPEIVPILVGSFHDYLQSGREPVGEVEDFIGAVAESAKVLMESGKRVLFYSGVDLAHMGINFGDTYHVSSVELDLIEKRDRVLLDAVLSSSPQGLFSHMAEDCDRRRICGFPSLYTKLSVMKSLSLNTEGHLLEYRQAVDQRSDCTVTFAGAYWEER